MTITDILQQPDKCTIDSIQGKVISVYDVRHVAKLNKDVTDLKMADGGGNQIKVSVWEMPNMLFYKGKEVVISAGPRGGLKVSYDDYSKRNTVQVSKSVQFQVIQGGIPVAAPQTPVPANPSHSDGPAHTNAPTKANLTRNGQQVGMAVKAGVDLAIARMESGQPVTDLDAYLKGTASLILKVSDWLEQGNLAEEKKEENKEDVPY